MPTTSDDQLISRLTFLERKLASTRRLLGVAILAGLVLLLTGFAQSTTIDTLRAKRFVLVDDSGAERAKLEVNDRTAGLYLYARTPTKDAEPLLALEVARTEGELPALEYAIAKFRSEFTASTASRSATHVGIYSEKIEEGVNLSLLNSPSLEFVDRSGSPYVQISHDSKNGVRIEMREPLGIKNASDEARKATLEKREVDPRIEDAWRRSLRFECVAPPFADPYMTLYKDGRVIWSAK